MDLTFKTENSNKEFLEWIPLEKLKITYLYPEFFKTELEISSQQLRYILTNEV